MHHIMEWVRQNDRIAERAGGFEHLQERPAAGARARVLFRGACGGRGAYGPPRPPGLGGAARPLRPAEGLFAGVIVIRLRIA